MKCEYDKIITTPELVHNIKKKAHESYAEHIKKLIERYDDKA